MPAAELEMPAVVEQKASGDVDNAAVVEA